MPRLPYIVVYRPHPDLARQLGTHKPSINESYIVVSEDEAEPIGDMMVISI